MALKGPRSIIEYDITQTCPTARLRGLTLCYLTGGSGVALGNSAGSADVAANPSGSAVAGMLLGDVVNIDVTRQHLNFQKDETQVGNRVSLVRKGRLTTDALSGSPNAGDKAYLTTNGQLTPTMSATGGLAATPLVGRFVAPKDESGFVTVDINLPI